MINGFELIGDFFAIAANLLTEKFRCQGSGYLKIKTGWWNGSDHAETQLRCFELEPTFGLAGKEH